MSPPYDASTTASTLATDFAAQIANKVVLTTGVTPGSIGGTFIQSIATANPGLLILAGRDAAKLQALIATLPASVPTKTLVVDFASSASVRGAAAQVSSWADVPAIDVLVSNAGIMATPYATVAGGIERQWGVNYLFPWLFANLVMDKLLASPGGGRVVNVSSDGHRLSCIRFRGDEGFHDGANYDKWRAYGQSKTAQMLMCTSLAGKLGRRGLTAVSLHPGVVGGTKLGAHVEWGKEFGDLAAVDRQMGNHEGWREKFNYKTQDQGAATLVYAAFADELKEHNGAYLCDSHVADPRIDTVKPWATSPVEAEMLWALSENQLGVRFDY